MLSIDPALLPALATRKALLVIDAQNDFLAEDGALSAKWPIELPQSIAKLANGFRQRGGEIIWVQSQFVESRRPADEQILTADCAPPTPRGRRPRAPEPVPAPSAGTSEAFLSVTTGQQPTCAVPGALGTEMHPVVKEAVAPKDHNVVKTYYSALKSDELVRILRVKLVTELFICGSLVNVGVMATATDAASYGYTITIVEDCCGALTFGKRNAAIRQMTSTTGCAKLSAIDALNSIAPTKSAPPSKRMGAGSGSTTARSSLPSVRRNIRGTADGVLPSSSSSSSHTSDIQSSLERLTLNDGESTAAEKPSSPSSPYHQQRGQSPEPTSALAFQSLARRHDAQVQGQSDRNILKPSFDTQLGQEDMSPRNESSGLTTRKEAQTPVAKPRGAFVEKSARLELKDDARNKSKDGDNPNKADNEPSPIIPTNEKEASFSSDDQEGLDLDTFTLWTSPHFINDPMRGLSLLRKESKPSLQSTIVQDKDIKNTSEMHFEEQRTAFDQSQSQPLCEGDTRILYSVLPEPLALEAFEKLNAEVEWKRMSHQGGEVPRLVAVQGEIGPDHSIPIYRHPADESPPLLAFTPTVNELRRIIEVKLGHPLNHVLIQLYRHGNDYISEHSDKTLDIARGSYIANLSLGAERTMTFRTKRQSKDNTRDSSDADATLPGCPMRQVQRAALPHNSLCQMGLKTNERWLHAIRQDKRLTRDKTDAELAFEGMRISLTFRYIGTFLDSGKGSGEGDDITRIWGQGATSKTKAGAREVINGQTPEAVDMLRAFGRENQSSAFDWDAHYGAGFDVLHITASARLFLSADPVVNMRVQMMLAELGIGYARGSITQPTASRNNHNNSLGGGSGISSSSDAPIKYVDNDGYKTVVQGQIGIMLYLWNVRRNAQRTTISDDHAAVREQLERFKQGIALVDEWRRLALSSHPSKKETTKLLTPFEQYLREAVDNYVDGYMAGAMLGLVDFAIWPFLHAIVASSPGIIGEERRVETEVQIEAEAEAEAETEAETELPNLTAYYYRVRDRESVRRMLDSVAEPGARHDYSASP